MIFLIPITIILAFDILVLHDALKTVLLDKQSLSKVVSEYTLVDNIGLLSLGNGLVIGINVVGLCLLYLYYQRTQKHKLFLAIIALLMMIAASLNQANSYRIIHTFNAL